MWKRSQKGVFERIRLECLGQFRKLQERKTLNDVSLQESISKICFLEQLEIS